MVEEMGKFSDNQSRASRARPCTLVPPHHFRKPLPLPNDIITARAWRFPQAPVPTTAETLVSYVCLT
jgi:hypothetical protein